MIKKQKNERQFRIFHGKVFQILYRKGVLVYNIVEVKWLMKYTNQALKYIFRNFFYIFPFAILPAVCLALSLDNDAIRLLLTGIFKGKVDSSFWDVFHAVSFLCFHHWDNILSGLAGIFLLVFCISMLMAFLEKHMRIGKRTLNGLFAKINDNLISTGGICLLFFAIYEVWALILSAILYFVCLVPQPVVVAVVCGVVYLAAQFVLLGVVSRLYLWLPCLQITGFRAFEALRYSHQLVAPVKARVIWEQFVSIFVSNVLIAVTACFLPQAVWTTVVATLLYAFMTLIFCVKMQVVYFDRDQRERADLRKYYHY